MATELKAKAEDKNEPIERRSSVFPSLPEEVSRWFNESLPHHWLQPGHWMLPGWPEGISPFEGRLPKVDLVDRAKELVVRAELPGVQKKDLEVSMTEHTVTIRATTHHEDEKEEGEYFRKEMSRGEFLRTIPLPAEVQTEKVKSVFENGVLELKFTKSKKSKRKTIEIQ
jgi:HSP20 family protein